MTTNDFFEKYEGKKVDYDGAYGVQCFDFANQYCKDVIGCTGFVGLHAYQIYADFDTQPNKSYFDRLKNTPALVPQAGDIVVWSQRLNGQDGHVAVATGEGNPDYFYSYDENWNGNGQVCTKIRHSYDYVLGVLRKKQNDVLDKSGYKRGDHTSGSYALKQLLILDGAKLDDNSIVGGGTVSAINARLEKWGYKPTGVAGNSFIKQLRKNIQK